MDSYKYNFTYKDVLKRYERIINKPSKFEIKLLATILLVITIVNITSLCFASEEEDVEIHVANNLGISTNQNYFNYNDTYNIGYVEIEKGYIYTFYNNLPGYDVICAFSYDVPAVNVVYYDTFTTDRNSSYSFISDDYDYMFFDFQQNYVLRVTRKKIVGYDTAVSELVDNVGISQVWDIFDTSIGFVVVVVLAAFGIFLVVIAIRKIQKGKSEF